MVNLVQSGSKIPKWVLTEFNDPSIQSPSVWVDPEELKFAIQSLRFESWNNPDLPEQALQGNQKFK